jgi:hypothetical protein
MLHRILTLCLLSSVLLVGDLSPLAAQSQDTVTIACGTDQSTGSSLPSVFPGIFYNLLNYPRQEYLYRFERIRAAGRDEVVAPLTQEQVLSVSRTTVSSDGRLIAFRPASPQDDDLIVWNVETDDLASIQVTQDEAAMLSTPAETYALDSNKLVWHGSSQLVIQYFDEEGNGVVARTFIHVDVQENAQQPLLLTRGNTETFDLTAVPVPTGYEVFRRYYSPQQTYIAQEIGRSGERRLQILEAATGEQVFLSPAHPRLLARAAWPIDETNLVYRVRNSNSETELFQVDLHSDAIPTMPLLERLRDTLGAGTFLVSVFEPVYSRDGQWLTIMVYTPETQRDYFIFHNLQTGETNAVCNSFNLNLDYESYAAYLLPEGRYFAIYQWERTYIIDRQTGDYYITPSLSNVGWAKGPNVPPVADAGTDQVVPTATTAQVTLDASGSTDSDGTIIRYIWKENGQQIARRVNPTVNLAPGVHTLTLEVTDHDYDVATDEVTISVTAP